MADTAWREPEELAAGDTLCFERALRDYPATDGWSLTYELRGGAQPIEFISVADGASHKIEVAAAVTATWLPGDYAFTGYVIKGDERHRIFYGDFKLWPNAQDMPGNQPVQTFAQKMVAQLELVMLAKAGDDLAASQSGETRFQLLTPEELRLEHGYWSQIRKQEIARERAKLGRPTGNKIRPIFNISLQGSGNLGGGVYPFGR